MDHLVRLPDKHGAAVCRSSPVDWRDAVQSSNAAMQQSQQDLLLLYSNRRPEDFVSESSFSKEESKFRLKATMTDMAHSAVDWSGDTQTIDREWPSRPLRAWLIRSLCCFHGGGNAAVAAISRH
ncbi:hypothetical protein J4714_14165 [Staphylococcus epidermidis]|nr:hypothetical protein [Staphylococcus epidermidis]